MTRHARKHKGRRSTHPHTGGGGEITVRVERPSRDTPVVVAPVDPLFDKRVTHRAWRVYMLLASQTEPLSPKQIAEKMHISVATARRALANLNALGYLPIDREAIAEAQGAYEDARDDEADPQ